jgi:hypothetical protein
MNNNKFQLQFQALLIAALVALATPASAAVESKDPIKLTIHDRAGQYLTTHILGEERFRSVRTLKE